MNIRWNIPLAVSHPTTCISHEILYCMKEQRIILQLVVNELLTKRWILWNVRFIVELFRTNFITDGVLSWCDQFYQRYKNVQMSADNWLFNQPSSGEVGQESLRSPWSSRGDSSRLQNTWRMHPRRQPSTQFTQGTVQYSWYDGLEQISTVLFFTCVSDSLVNVRCGLIVFTSSMFMLAEQVYYSFKVSNHGIMTPRLTFLFSCEYSKHSTELVRY